MGLLDSLKSYQRRSIRVTQPFFHKSIPRYTPFKFKKLSNVIDLTKGSNYWEGPLNVGLCHVIFAFLCATAMYLALICFPVCRQPSNTCVCASKFVISGVGFLGFVFSFFEFYSHVGVFHLWGPLTLKTTLEEERLGICNYIQNISGPLSTKITEGIAKCAPALEAVKENVPIDPDFSQYKDGLSVYTKHVEKLSTITYDVAENVKNIVEFLNPLCKSNPKRVVVPIGEWNYTYLVQKITWDYTPVGFGLSIWTLVLTFHIMRIIFKRNTYCLHILCILGSLTVLAWWGACAYIIPYIIGIADFNSRRIDGILPIVQQLDPNMTNVREKLNVFLNCSGNSKSHWPFLKDFEAISRPIMTIHEQSELALDRGFKNFPPSSRKPEYSLFLTELYNLTEYLYPISRGLILLNSDDCTYYQAEFERVFSWLVREVYWALYVAYASGVILCLLLTIAVCMMLRIRCNFYLVCYQKSHKVEEPDIIKCLPECPRRKEDDDPLPPIRQRCPPSCTGVHVMKQEVKKLVNTVMNLPSHLKQNGNPAEPADLKHQQPVYCTRPESIPPQPKPAQVLKQKQEVYCVNEGKTPAQGKPSQGLKQKQEVYCVNEGKTPTQGKPSQGSKQRQTLFGNKMKGPQLDTLHEAQPTQGQSKPQDKRPAKVEVYKPFGKKMLSKYKNRKLEKQAQQMKRFVNTKDTPCKGPCAKPPAGTEDQGPAERKKLSRTRRIRRGSRNTKLTTIPI